MTLGKQTRSGTSAAATGAGWDAAAVAAPGRRTLAEALPTDGHVAVGTLASVAHPSAAAQSERRPQAPGGALSLEAESPRGSAHGPGGVAAPGDAAHYFTLHRRTFLAMARTELQAARLSTGSPRLTWSHGPARFAEQLTYHLAAPLPDELPGLLYPSDPWRLIDEQRGAAEPKAPPGGALSGPARGTMAWNPSAGLAIAIAIERVVRLRLPRVSARYVAEGGARSGGDLIAGHPMDRVIAGALCVDGVVTLHKARTSRGTPTPSASDDLQARGPNLISDYEWLGDRDPRLWNWLQVKEPPSVTAEEVALSIWGDPQYAYGLVVTGSYVGVPEAWAAKIPAAAAHKPLALPADSLGEQLATSAIADEVALAQATRAESSRPAHPLGKQVPGAPDREHVLAALESSAAILNELDLQLGPWALDPRLSPARKFVRDKWQALVTAAPEDVARWTTVLLDQRDLLREAATGIVQALALLARAGIDPAKARLGDRSDPAVEVLHSFAQAAGMSQLTDIARAALAQGRTALAGLPVALVARAGAEASHELGRLRDDEAADPSVARGRSQTLGAEQRQLSGETTRLQVQVLAGGAPDAAQLEAASLDAMMLRFRARLARLQHLLGQLRAGIEAADRGVVASIANALSWEVILVPFELENAIGDLQGIDDELARYTQAAIHKKWDARQIDVHDRERGRQFELHETRKAQLAIAQQRLAEVTQRRRLDGALLRRAEQTIQDQRLRAILVDLAAMVALAVISGGIASVAGEAVSGAIGGARTATTLAEATHVARTAHLAGRITSFVIDAAGQAVGQTALHGGNVGSSFAENLVTNAAVIAALRPLHAAVQSWGPLSEQAFQAWSAHGQHLRIALAKGAVITAELMTSMAVAYATKRVITAAQGETPDEATVASWAVQGASMALGRMIHVRLSESMERLQLAGHAFGDLLGRMRVQARQAELVEQQRRSGGSPDAAMNLLIEHHRLLEEEIAIWQRLRDDPAALRQLKMTPRQVEVKLRGAQDQQSDTQSQTFRHMPLLLSGLSPEFEGGRLWVGDTEDVAIALAQARRAGLSLVVHEHDVAARHWRITLDGEELVIRERARDGRVRDAKPADQVTTEDVALARRYAAAARDLRPVLEAQTRTVVEAGEDFATDTVQIGHGFGGVMNQDTRPEHGNPGDPHKQLIVYEHDGAMTSRGELRTGQTANQQTMPGVRTREHTTDQIRYARSRELGEATEIGRVPGQGRTRRGAAQHLAARLDAPREEGPDPRGQRSWRAVDLHRPHRRHDRRRTDQLRASARDRR